MSVRKSDLYNFLPMSIKDLNKIYDLELESYDFPWNPVSQRPWSESRPIYNMIYYIIYNI